MAMFMYAISSLKIMWKYARSATLLKFFEIVLSASMTPLSLFFTQQLINSIAQRLPVNNSILWGTLLISAMFLLSSSNFISGIQNIHMQRKLNEGFTNSVLDKYKKVDYSCFEDSSVQDSLTRMGNAPQEKILEIFLAITRIISSIISIIGLLILFSQISGFLSVIFIVIIALMIWANFKAMDMMNTMFNNQTEDERKLSYYSTLLSAKSSLVELKVFCAIDYIQSLWNEKNKKVLNERVSTTIRSQKYTAITRLIIITWIALVIFSLINGIKDNSLTIGLFASLIGACGGLLGTVEQLSFAFSNVSQQYLNMKHYDIFTKLPEIIENSNSIALNRNIHIKFENVHFTYPKTNKEILKGISFDIYPHERVALVGENGAGKSTIVKLLCRLYAPTQGSILVNGYNLNDLSTKQLQSIFSVIFQDYACYSLSLRENIALGDIQKIDNDREILQALKKGLADDISDTIDVNLGKIENDGIDVSGGQWQRIAISRALLPESSFIILDEPTASLDPIAESEMYTTFSSLLQDKGCVMISHRLASAKMADKIIVINDGIIGETGTHAELLDNHQLYENMWNKQSSWYDGEGKNEDE